MIKTTQWAFPENLQPNPKELEFDFESTLASAVMIRSEIPEDAFTASILGTERVGNGVVIREDGLILTIGYLITEAETLWLTTNHGTAVQGHPIAYDFATGFGLVQALGRLNVPAVQRGSATQCNVGSNVVIIGQGGREHALKAKVIAKREFAGYWEYLIDEAIFTAPAHPQWGGTALLGEDGRLLGIGSLLVQEKVDEDTTQGNMFVPVDLLEPILDDLLRRGQANRPARPWLGVYLVDTEGKLGIGGLATGGPADRAGLRSGDLIAAVAGQKVLGLADLFRKIWRLGRAGVEIPMTIIRRGAVMQVRITSADRSEFLKKPRLH